MRHIRLFFIAVFLLLSFLCLITIFLPSRVTVSKSVLVNANIKTVEAQIINFDNWNNWYPLFQNKDIAVSITKNIDTSFATLTNANQKKLSFSLLNSSSGTIKIALSEENKVNDTYQFLLIPNGIGNTQLTWNINTNLGWNPWKKLAGIFMDKIKGPGYESALQNLKAAAENASH